MIADWCHLLHLFFTQSRLSLLLPGFYRWQRPSILGEAQSRQAQEPQYVMFYLFDFLLYKDKSNNRTYYGILPAQLAQHRVKRPPLAAEHGNLRSRLTRLGALAGTQARRDQHQQCALVARVD